MSHIELTQYFYPLEEDVTNYSECFCVQTQSVRIELNIDRVCRQVTVSGFKNSPTMAYKCTLGIIFHGTTNKSFKVTTYHKHKTNQKT